MILPQVIGSLSPGPDGFQQRLKETGYLDDDLPIEFVIADIDSYDYEILLDIVNSGKKVLVYEIEAAFQFPPPYQYASLYDEEAVKAV